MSGPMPLLRTALGVLLMAAITTTALLLLAVTWSPGFVLRVLSRRWGRWMCAVTGIRLEVEGQEHLARPAVIVANHQSALEAFIVPAVVPSKTRYVVKKEILRIPLFGWALRATGQIFVDRADSSAAISAITASLATLPPGVSIFLCPEGTRSQDGGLLPFKKGAFHMAIQLKLPVVPMTADGAHQILPKYAWFPRPGPVRVRISPPIDTSGWTLDRIDEHVAEVRGVIARDLEHLRAAHQG